MKTVISGEVCTVQKACLPLDFWKTGRSEEAGAYGHRMMGIRTSPVDDEMCGGEDLLQCDIVHCVVLIVYVESGGGD